MASLNCSLTLLGLVDAEAKLKEEEEAKLKEPPEPKADVDELVATEPKDREGAVPPKVKEVPNTLGVALVEEVVVVEELEPAAAVIPPKEMDEPPNVNPPPVEDAAGAAVVVGAFPSRGASQAPH